MTTIKEEVEDLIDKLEREAEALEDIGNNFSASTMRVEAERLQALLDKGVVPQLYDNN